MPGDIKLFRLYSFVFGDLPPKHKAVFFKVMNEDDLVYSAHIGLHRHRFNPKKFAAVTFYFNSRLWAIYFRK